MSRKINIENMLFFNSQNVEQLDDYRKARFKERFFSKQDVLNWLDNENVAIFFDSPKEKIIECISNLPNNNTIIDLVFNFEMSDDPNEIFVQTELKFQTVV